MISSALASEHLVKVVADTGPLNYLVLIEEIGILPALFTRIAIPEAVRTELSHPETPAPVRRWLDADPTWLAVEPDLAPDDPALQTLDIGERKALALAMATRADLVLMDDRAGVTLGRAMGFAVTGTIGLIDLAGRRGLVDVAGAVARLQATSFHCRPALLRTLLAQHRAP